MIRKSVKRFSDKIMPKQKLDQEKCDAACRQVTLKSAIARNLRPLERRQLQTVNQRSMLAVVSKE